MNLDEDDARERLSSARVARLATIDEHGRPAVVPCCFVLHGDTIYSAVDDKPKTTTQLARLANVEANPRVALVVDHYDEDWSQLWWVRVRGTGRVVGDDDERDRAVTLLREKYPQYADHRLDGAVLAVDVEGWRAWSVRSPHG